MNGVFLIDKIERIELERFIESEVVFEKSLLNFISYTFK
jgi:hypothetical protein